MEPNPPFYLFLPQEQAYREEYEKGWSVNKIFPINNVGITTARDALTIQFSEDEIRKTVKDFKALSVETAREKYHLGPDARDWKVDLAQQDLRTSKGYYLPLLYRPFDIRFTYYTGVSRGFHCMPRGELMRQMYVQKNIGFGTTKGVESGGVFEHIFVCSSLFTHHTVSIKEVNYLFPLWRYPTETEKAMGIEREANLDPKFVTEVKERIGETPTPEDIFHYAYGVFHAPTYRTRYAAFLKTDFPRLPLPPDGETFHELAALGAKLTALHLLEAPELTAHGIGFPVSGDHVVKKMKASERYSEPTPKQVSTLPKREGKEVGALLAAPFDPAAPSFAASGTPRPPASGGPLRSDLSQSKEVGSVGRVRLNDAEYFENVPPEAWEFRVGGYQPASKWLDDRAGRALTTEDITHYRRMIAAMRETAALLPLVDAAFVKLLAAYGAAV